MNIPKLHPEIKKLHMSSVINLKSKDPKFTQLRDAILAMTEFTTLYQLSQNLDVLIGESRHALALKTIAANRLLELK